MPGLMRHAVAEVECSDPCLEPCVKPVVAECLGAVVIAMGGCEQRQPGAFGTAAKGVRSPIRGFESLPHTPRIARFWRLLARWRC